MKINQGHAICLANGIKYALNEYQFDRLILMDADGEDRPEEINEFLEKIKNSNLFKPHEIGWIKPKNKAYNDIRTTFYNKKSLELLGVIS